MTKLVFYILALIASLGYASSHPQQQIPIEEPLEDWGETLFLTPYIEANRTEEGRAAARVNSTLFHNITSYSGFFTVDKATDSNIFFWYFPSANDPATDPVALWLQGGPGLSGLYGVFKENGPFIVEDDIVSLRDFSWHKNFSVIYIDQPVGTGYSFTNGSLLTNRTEIGEHVYSALAQFFAVFSELRQNDFFIISEAYTGQHALEVANVIRDHHQNGDDSVQLEGVVIASGLIDPINQLDFGDVLYSFGLIDDHHRYMMKIVEVGVAGSITSGDYSTATEIYDDLILVTMPRYATISNTFDLRKDTGDDDDTTSWRGFAVRKDVKKALHVGRRLFYGVSEDVFRTLDFERVKSAAPLLKQALKHYRVLLFNGQFDLKSAYQLTRNYLKALDFDGADSLYNSDRNPLTLNGRVAAYFKKGGLLTEAMVRDAGHKIVIDQPEVALTLITKFLRDEL